MGDQERFDVLTFNSLKSAEEDDQRIRQDADPRVEPVRRGCERQRHAASEPNGTPTIRKRCKTKAGKPLAQQVPQGFGRQREDRDERPCLKTALSMIAEADRAGRRPATGAGSRQCRCVRKATGL